MFIAETGSHVSVEAGGGRFIWVGLGAGWFLAANFATSGDTWNSIELFVLLFLFGVSLLRTQRVPATSDERLYEIGRFKSTQAFRTLNS
jgi:hypothetical protein